MGHASLASVYLSLASMFLLDRLSQRLLVPPPRERISAVRSGLCGRNLYQLLVSPLVVLGYSLVEFWALIELAVRGREVCSHKPSNKTEL